MLGVCLFGDRCFFRLGHGQAHGEAASLARFAIHCDASFQQLHRIGNDGKFQSESVFRHGVAQPLKRNEYPCLLLFCHLIHFFIVHFYVFCLDEPEKESRLPLAGVRKGQAE